MSKLNNLLQDLCPNGVKYAKLGTVATISRGGNFQKKDFCEIGVPCIHYGQIYTRYGLFTDKTLSFISEETAKKQKYAVKNDIIMAVTSENIEDVCKCVAWLGEQKIAVSGHSAIIHHTINPKFLCYYFHTEMFASQKKKLAHGTKVIEVTPDKLSDIIIPIPPLPIQEEIVRILDSYTKMTEELESKLKAELEARKKQYEFYRDSLLKFDTGEGSSECIWSSISLSDIGKVSMCKRILKSETSNTGDIPFYKIGTFGGKANAYITKELFEKYKSQYSYPKKGDILISAAGTIGKTVIYDGKPAYYQDSNIVWIDNDEKLVLNRFLFYVYQLNPWQVSTGGTIARLYNDNIANATIIVPPLHEQERIVKILDRFDKLCNDLTEGLPAEIESRRKQYEYYRDKLLTFTPAQ